LEFRGLAQDSDDFENFHVAFHTNHLFFGAGGLYYVLANESGYAEQQIFDGEVDWVRIAANSQARPHVAFTNGVWRIRRNLAGSWTTITLGHSNIIDVDIVVDADDNVHTISSASDGTIRYAGSAESWSQTVIAEGGMRGSLGVRDGIVHVSYYDVENGYLMYVSGSTTVGWNQPELVDDGGAGPGEFSVGEQSALVIGDDARVHIAYYDHTYRRLKYATRIDETWQISVVDESAYVGQSIRMTLTSEGFPLMAYRNSTDSEIKIATNAPGNWMSHTIAGTPNTREQGLEVGLLTTGDPWVVYIGGDSVHVRADIFGSVPVRRLERASTF
jgi:hypothetical protein